MNKLFEQIWNQIQTADIPVLSKYGTTDGNQYRANMEPNPYQWCYNIEQIKKSEYIFVNVALHYPVITGAKALPI